MTDSEHTHAFRLHHDIDTCLNQYLGTWGGDLLSHLACSPLYEHHGATQYSASSTPLLDVRPPAGTRIKTSVTRCLAPAIER
jgi:hypothetical protein